MDRRPADVESPLVSFGKYPTGDEEDRRSDLRGLQSSKESGDDRSLVKFAARRFELFTMRTRLSKLVPSGISGATPVQGGTTSSNFLVRGQSEPVTPDPLMGIFGMPKHLAEGTIL